MITRQEIEAFHAFACQYIAEGSEVDSFEDLLRQWRQLREQESVLEAIQRGLDAVANGQSRSVHQFLDERELRDA